MRPFTLDIFINNDKEDLKRKWERIREAGIQKIGKTKVSEVTHKHNKRQKKRLATTGNHLELDRSGWSHWRLR